MTLLVPSGRRRGPFVNLFDPDAPLLKVHVEGNSISSGLVTSPGSLTLYIKQTEPLASAPSVLYATTATGGAQWTDLIARGATVDASFVAGRNNLLILNEHINALYLDRNTVEQVQAQVTEYLAARLAANPWRVIYWRTVPYGGGPAFAKMNAEMTFLDDWMETNKNTLGIERVVDPRVIPAFDHDGTSPDPYIEYAAWWEETEYRWIHPENIGQIEIAKLIVAAMETMPAVAP